MKTSTTRCLAAIYMLSNAASAIPLIWPAKNLLVRAAVPQSYSVVAVDGGSSISTPAAQPATKTITDATTQMQTATATVLSTIISTVSTSGANPSSAPAAPPAPVTTVISQTVTYATTVVPAAATVTVEPQVSSVPFDNGQWHTTYYFKTTGAAGDVDAAVATSAASLVAVAAAAASPTTSMDPGQWAYWNQRDSQNNGQA